MLELFGGGLLGSLFGGLFRLAPEVLKFFDKKNERDHELKMFTLQTDLEKIRGEYRMEERYVDHSIHTLDAIGEAFKQQGEADKRAWKWVASASALVRPGVTYILFFMYVVFKMATISYAMNGAADWKQIFLTVWTIEDFALLNMVLTFWFVGRTIERR
jgi:hypothetical protein